MAAFRGATVAAVSVFNSVVSHSGVTTSFTGPTFDTSKVNIQAVSLMSNTGTTGQTGAPTISGSPTASVTSYLAGYISGGIWLFDTAPGSAQTITLGSGNVTSNSRLAYDISVTVAGSPICMIV
jgi:hypothetical protein